MKTLSIFCASLAIAFGSWIAYHLFILTVYGSGIISEPNKYIAAGELVFTIVCVIIAIYTWLKLIRLGGYEKIK